ncbi:hypothetical protein P7C73_g3307, partial [Tremellales sp. Uapishka_1]
MSKAPPPPGIGAGKPAHPFAVTVEEPVPNSIVPDGYGIKYHAYHTILPTGTSLPGGAVLPMSSVADFPMYVPAGSKMPGGVMVPVSPVYDTKQTPDLPNKIVMQKVDKKAAARKEPEPICSIQ